MPLFRQEWAFARGLTYALLRRLTDEELLYSPGPTLGAFWKQFRHVGGVQECYLQALSSGMIRFVYTDKRYHGGPSGAALLAYLAELDRELEDHLLHVDWEQLIDWGEEKIGANEHLLRLVSHETLHHGEWIVYMHLLGKPFPPEWRAWGL